MTSQTKLLAAIAAVGMIAGTGCLAQPSSSGDDDTPTADARPGGSTPDGPGGTPRNAKTEFIANVYPALATVAGRCQTCHIPGGLGLPTFVVAGDPDLTYQSIEDVGSAIHGGWTIEAPMLTTMRAPTKLPVHAAVPDFSIAEVQAIETWLASETTARAVGPGPGVDAGGGGGPLTPAAQSRLLIQEWSGCMNLADWDAEGVAVAWANKGTAEGTCLKCHINGQSSFIATRDSARMFEVLSTNKYYMQGYFSADPINPEGPKMVINTVTLDTVGNGDAPYVEHPLFNVGGGELDALTRFYEATMARKLAGTCDPPRITD